MPPRRAPTPLADASRRATILRNIFPAAHAALEPWEAFRWHGGPGERSDTYKTHSSQALAVDVFGTLQQAAGRDRALAAVARAAGVPTAGPWTVALEWHDPGNALREKQPTWVDAVARSPHSLIFFECKFTEHDGGRCTQTQANPRGQRPCTGRYMWQTNPANGREARCALTGKGIRYWEEIPRVFDYDAEASYFECPFAGAWFQWMRNLTVCAAAARREGLRPALVLAYADGPGLPMAARVRGAEWARLLSRLQPGVIGLHALSLQTLVGLARAANPAEPVWDELAAWVQRKIDEVCAARNPVGFEG